MRLNIRSCAALIDLSLTPCGRIHFLDMAGKRYIKKLVHEFCNKGSSEAVAHYNDIMHTILLLYNYVVTSLRKYSSTGGSWVDLIFRVSGVIPDTEEIRERLRIDEGNYKTAIRDYYFELELMRLPSGAKDFKHLARKMVKSLGGDNYVIGWVLEVVTKMYRVHMESLNRECVESENTNRNG